MEIKLYKLYDTATELFNRGGNNWGKKGKSWTELYHLKTKLTSDAKDKLDRAYGRKEVTKQERDVMYYSVYYENNDAKLAMYRCFIPESWVIIEITNNGARELCKAQDLLLYERKVD